MKVRTRPEEIFLWVSNGEAVLEFQPRATPWDLGKPEMRMPTPKAFANSSPGQRPGLQSAND